MGNQKDKPVEDASTPPQGETRKKRHWLRRLVIALAVIGLLVLVSPYVISSGPVLGWILSSVNGGIRGHVEVDELSLGWLSPVSARGIVVLDAQRRQVLSVREVRAEKGLLGLAVGPMAFGRVEVDEPNVVLHQGADGQFSLSGALKSTGPPSPAEPAGELPRPRGTIVVRQASVTFVDPNGRRTALSADSQVDMQTLDHLVGTSTTRFPNGGVLQMKYDLSGLVHDGKLQPGNISGTMEVWTDKPIDLEPLGGFALPDKGVAGTVDLSANVKLDRGRPTGRCALSVVDLKAGGKDAVQLRPVSFGVIATAALKDKDVTGMMRLEGDLGRFVGTYLYRPGPMPDLTAQKLLSAVLAGEMPALPEMELDANAQVDLAALANAVPLLLRLRQGVTVAAGTVTLANLTVRGGSVPSVKVAAGLDGVRAVQTQRDGQQRLITLEPISVDIDSAIVGGSGLKVRQLELKSAFASVDGSGTPKDFHARYNADLAAARTEIGKIIDLKKFALEGILKGSMDVAMAGNERLNYRLDANTANVSWADGNQPPLKVQIAAMSGKGYLTHKAGNDVKITAETFEVRADNDLAISGHGMVDTATGAVDANAFIQRADLAGLLRAARAFGVEVAKPVTGSLTGQIKAVRKSSTEPIVADGTLALRQLRIDNKPVGVELMTFKQDLRIEPNKQDIRIVAASIESDMLAVTASGTVSKLSTEKLLDIRGHYRGRWDKIMAVAHELAPATKDIIMTGPLESDFVLTGPARRPTLMPIHPSMKAEAGVGWQTARLMGFDLGKVDIPITLKDGNMVLPATQILAPGGKVNLAATVDFSKPDPQILMPGKLVVLENLEINREVGRKVLSRFNPVFGQLLSLQGRITLVTQDIDVPMGEAIKKGGSGSGTLDLSGLQFEPDGLMAALLELGGLGGKQLVQVGAADFVIRDGALRYDNFSMTFGKSFDLHFRGAVRFDDSVDMVVSVPVRAELLKKLGVGGSAGQYAKLLEGARIDVPIIGTREKPSMDFAKVDIQPLLKKAAEKMLNKEVGGLLDGLLKPKKPDKPAPDQQTPPQPPPGERKNPPDRPGPSTQKATEKPEDMLIRGIFDALDQWGKDKDKK